MTYGVRTLPEGTERGLRFVGRIRLEVQSLLPPCARPQARSPMQLVSRGSSQLPRDPELQPCASLGKPPARAAGAGKGTPSVNAGGTVRKLGAHLCRTEPSPRAAS